MCETDTLKMCSFLWHTQSAAVLSLLLSHIFYCLFCCLLFNETTPLVLYHLHMTRPPSARLPLALPPSFPLFLCYFHSVSFISVALFTFSFSFFCLSPSFFLSAVSSSLKCFHVCSHFYFRRGLEGSLPSFFYFLLLFQLGLPIFSCFFALFLLFFHFLFNITVWMYLISL